MVLLSRIMQKKKETLREYIDQLTKVIMDVGVTYEKLKCWTFKKGQRSDCMFWEKLVLERACTLNDILNKAQPYIRYEEELLATYNI